jgi:hypothetical protein
MTEHEFVSADTLGSLFLRDISATNMTTETLA